MTSVSIDTPLHTKKRIAIFASGAGSNAKKIIDHFSENALIKVELIACNKSGAGVINIARAHNIPVLMIDREEFFKGSAYINELQEAHIDFLVLAGFLWKIPGTLTNFYRNRIVNIHPALLPKYGGKGMYGDKVHEAVLAAGDKESGITIHYVDEYYDNGDVILQEKCKVLPDDTALILADRIHKLEHKHYPVVIEDLLTKLDS